VSTGFGWGVLKERDYWGDLDEDGRIILKLVFRMSDVDVCLDGVVSGQRQFEDSCEYGNEL
jgi:hypothetical protein